MTPSSQEMESPVNPGRFTQAEDKKSCQDQDKDIFSNYFNICGVELLVDIPSYFAKFFGDYFQLFHDVLRNHAHNPRRTIIMRQEGIDLSPRRNHVRA